MRYTKRALLVFGLGLIVGFALIVAEVPSFGLIGSAIMALGLVGLPIALVADGRIAFVQRILARFSRPKRPQPRRRGRVTTSRVIGRPARRRPPARVARRRRR
jgi:xanthosine utilization system XapX-like protein